MISIQAANTLSIPVIKELAYIIWPPTYSPILPAGQLEYMLDLIYSEASLQKQMERGHQFILIYNDTDAIGFASYSPKENTSIYKLHKLYINQNQQGKGIGKIAIDYICNDIKNKDAVSLELNVNRHNKALHFYQKLGFKIIGKEDIDIGNGYFMNDFVLGYQL